MKKFLITTEQKEKLKNTLTEEEYKNVFSFEGDDFLGELSCCILDRFDGDGAHTPESSQLEDIYFEILNQNT